MIALKYAEYLIGIITFLLVYLAVIPCANFFRAWVAKKMGDDMGEQLGFLTLNPLVHIDPIGVIVLLIFYFGWGRLVPINPLNIYGSFRWLKLACAYFSDSIAYFTLGLGGIIVLISLFDVRIVSIVQYMVLTHNVSHLPIARMYPAASSLLVSLGFIVFALVYLTIVLSVLNFIMNVSHYILSLLAEQFADVARYAHYITILLPILLIIFFSGLLRLLTVNLIVYIGYAIARVFGIVV